MVLGGSLLAVAVIDSRRDGSEGGVTLIMKMRTYVEYTRNSFNIRRIHEK